jgi:hypothetical protein
MPETTSASDQVSGISKVNINVKHEEQVITLEFSIPLTRINMSPDKALFIASMLVRHALATIGAPAESSIQ